MFHGDYLRSMKSQQIYAIYSNSTSKQNNSAHWMYGSSTCNERAQHVSVGLFFFFLDKIEKIRMFLCRDYISMNFVRNKWKYWPPRCTSSAVGCSNIANERVCRRWQRSRSLSWDLLSKEGFQVSSVLLFYFKCYSFFSYFILFHFIWSFLQMNI